MTIKNFTAGPWKFSEGNYSPSSRPDRFAISTDYTTLCFGDEIEFYIAHMIKKCDAPLIASAPEMLDVILDTYNYLISNSIDIPQKMTAILQKLHNEGVCHE